MTAALLIVLVLATGFLAGLTVGVNWAMSYCRRQIRGLVLRAGECPDCWPWSCNCDRRAAR